VDWLEVIDQQAATVGIQWTTIGGTPRNLDRFSRFRPCEVLNDLYKKLPNKNGRTDRLAQFCFFSLLKSKWRPAIGWRSGSVEGCLLFNGFDSLILDHWQEPGFGRARNMCQRLTATHVSVDNTNCVSTIQIFIQDHLYPYFRREEPRQVHQPLGKRNCPNCGLFTMFWEVGTEGSTREVC